jgi:hypothetical protein
MDTRRKGRVLKWLLTAIVVLSLIVWFGSTEMVNWDNAARSDSVSSYQEFLARFPHGSHASEARSRLAARADADKKLRDAGTPSIAAVQSHTAAHDDSYTSFLKNSLDPSNTVEAAKRLDKSTLWQQLVSNPSDAVLFVYLNNYSSSSSRPARFFKRDRWFGRPLEKESIEALRSSDPEQRVWYVNKLASEGPNALLFTPYLIPLLDDSTSFRILSGPVIGSKNEIGTTSLSACAHSALQRITGQDFGDAKEWVKWWNEWWTLNRDQLQ